MPSLKRNGDETKTILTNFNVEVETKTILTNFNVEVEVDENEDGGWRE